MYQVISLVTGQGAYINEDPIKALREIQDLLNVNIKERDTLVIEKAELRQKYLEAQDELQKYVKANLDKDDKIVGLNHAIQDLKKQNAQLEGELQRQKECDYLATEKLHYFILNQTEKFQEMALKCLFPTLKEENAALKLEVQKLKGLIESAKKHIGMANLMLA